MTREFIIDMQVSGKYDEALYELETVEEALAEWSLMYPDEYTDAKDMVVEGFDDTPILVEEVHIDAINSFAIYNKEGA